MQRTEAQADKWMRHYEPRYRALCRTASGLYDAMCGARHIDPAQLKAAMDELEDLRTSWGAVVGADPPYEMSVAEILLTEVQIETAEAQT